MTIYRLYDRYDFLILTTVDRMLLREKLNETEWDNMDIKDIHVESVDSEDIEQHEQPLKVIQTEYGLDIARETADILDDINVLYNQLEDDKDTLQALKNERIVLDDMIRNMENRLNPHIADLGYSIDLVQAITNNAKKITQLTPDDKNAQERNLRFLMYLIEKEIKAL